MQRTTGQLLAAVMTPVFIGSMTPALSAQDIIVGFEAKQGDHFGQSLSYLPDMDGDGCDDFAVGAPYTDVGGLEQAGAVHIYSGRTGKHVRTFHGTQFWGLFGFDIDYAGITSTDGEPKLVIGAPYEDAPLVNSGNIWLVSYQREQGDDQWLDQGMSNIGMHKGSGWSVTGLAAPPGELANVAWSEINNGGGLVRVAEYVGPGWGYISNWHEGGGYAPGPPGMFGFSIADAGDLTGDGWSEIAIGEPFHGTQFNAPQAGRGVVYDYKTNETQFLFSVQGVDGFDWLGWSVASVGDINNDGIGDIGFGAPFADAVGEDGGMVVIHSGAWPFAQLDQVGGERSWQFGTSLCALGDIDHDGASEYAIGAPGFDDYSVDEGAAFIHDGWTGDVLEKEIGHQGQDRFGVALDGRGDFNGDGVRDLIVGAPWSSARSFRAGAVYIYYQ